MIPAIPPAMKRAFRPIVTRRSSGERWTSRTWGSARAGRRASPVRTVKSEGPCIPMPRCHACLGADVLRSQRRPESQAHRGDYEAAAKSSRREGRSFRLCLWFLPRDFCSHGGRGCLSALVLPCALRTHGGGDDGNAWAWRPREAMVLGPSWMSWTRVLRARPLTMNIQAPLATSAPLYRRKSAPDEFLKLT